MKKLTLPRTIIQMLRAHKVGLLVILLLGELSYFWLQTHRAQQEAPASIRTAIEVGAGVLGLAPRLERPLNLLVMGEDISYSGPSTPVYGWKGNTDTMMLIRLDPIHQRIVLLALPRDTYATIPGHGPSKINAANPLGGPALARTTVSNMLSIPVDRYVLANLFAVRDAVNALGGVEIYVPESMDYDDRAARLHIHFRRGWQTMNGDQVTSYLRFRHDSIGDIGRVQRQQAFVQTLLATLKQPVNWTKVPKLFAIINSNVRTDLRQDDLDRIIGFMGTRPEVVSLLLPGSFWDSNGVSFWRIDQAKTRALIDRYLHDAAEEPDTPVDASSPSIAVRGSPKQVEAVVRILQRRGYRAFADGYLVEPAAHTCLLANGDRRGGEVLAYRLGLRCVRISGTGNLYADYTLLVGEEGLAPEPKETTSD